jgi:hypothetical protein
MIGNPSEKYTVAVIVKHSFRDNDYRVDIHQIPEKFRDRPDYIKAHFQSKIFGNFEIVSITERISENKDFSGSDQDLVKYNKLLTAKRLNNGN